jgi:beta-lactamase regulating signal transducer with metallopeptidase domain/cytochrome c-type biogenesis protein CcmH/NrfG
MRDVLIPAVQFAFDLGLKATAVFAITGVALLLLRKSSAATRHLVGTFGLAAALVMPLLSLALPRIAVPLLPDPRPETLAPIATPASHEAAPPVSRRMLALSVPERPALAASSDMLAVAPAPRPKASIPWPGVALGLWALGTLAIGARLAVGWARVRRIARDATPVEDPDWNDERDLAARRLDLTRRVELMESAAVPVAMTSGLRRPLLFIGRVARLWEVERRRIVLLHELAHVRRLDWIALILAELAVALYWFHPVAWWLGRQVRRDAETACDDLVISAGTKPSVYAGHLLGIFRSLSSPVHPVAPALAIARPHHFEERLRAILDPRSARGERQGWLAGACAASLLVAAAAVATVEPWAPRPASEPESFAQARPATGARAALPAGPPAAAEAPTAACARNGRPGATGQVVPVVAPAEAADETPIDEEEASPELPEAPGTLPAVLTTAPRVAPDPAVGFVKAGHRYGKKRDADDWYGRGFELHQDGEYREAIAAFQKSIELGHKEAASSYNIACGYALLGESDQAFEWLQRAMDEGFDLSGYISHDDDLDSLKADPRWPEYKRLARQSESRSKQREREVVAIRYEKIVARNPSSGEPFYDIGIELLRADRYDLAAKAYQTAIDRGYRTATALYNQACALALAGDVDGAIDRLRRSLDAGFDQPDTMKKDDDLDALRGDPRFAALLKEARELSLDAGHDGWWHKGSRSGRRAQWREAAARYDAYAQKHPQQGRAWFNLGYASLASGEADAAARAFRKALDLGYRAPTTMYNLACTYSRLDQTDQAFEWLFKALDAGFDSTWTLRLDDDLDNLRGDPRYRKAIQIARAKDREDREED